MSDMSHTMAADPGDDLPRTLRRAREERNREAQAAAAAQPTAPLATAGHSFEPQPLPGFANSLEEGVVTAIRVPFLRLVAFFLKAVLAAIPAMLLLGVIVWGITHALSVYFPHLVKFKILLAVGG